MVNCRDGEPFFYSPRATFSARQPFGGHIPVVGGTGANVIFVQLAFLISSIQALSEYKDRHCLGRKKHPRKLQSRAGEGTGLERVCW